MSYSGFKETHEFHLPDGQEVLFELIDKESTTRVNIDKLFIEYIRWDEVDAYREKLQANPPTRRDDR